MKKRIMIFSVIIFIVLLTTACDRNTTLKCTVSTDEYDLNLIYGFDGRILKTMGLQYIIDVSAYSDKEIKLLEQQDYCNYIKLHENFIEFSEAFEKCEQKLDNKKIVIDADFDINKVPSEELSKMQSYHDAKKELESSGYKCTLEK